MACAQQPRAFDADRPIAERGAFGGAGDDPDVLGHDVSYHVLCATCYVLRATCYVLRATGDVLPTDRRCNVRNTSSGGLAFLDFARLVASGPADDVSRILTSTRILPTASAEVGATRQRGGRLLPRHICHYVYGGDTALHVAAAAFRRPTPQKLPIRHGAHVGARNRRGAQPLHYASDGNHANPAAQAATIEYPGARSALIARGRPLGSGPPAPSRPNPLPCGGARVLLDAVPIPGSRMRPARRRCILRFNPRDAEALVRRRHVGSRLPSCSCCSSGARS